MRRAQPKPKEQRRVPIPGELRDSLKEVWEQVQQASHDPDIALDFDDAIQVGAVCGGRVGVGSRPYALTYYPAGDAQRGRWFLKLHPAEIEDIADGSQTEILMHCCTAPGCHCKFREEGELCDDCDYVPDREYAHLAVEDALPRLEEMGIAGLTAVASRDDVLAILGQPQISGGDVQDPVLGYVNPWIKYRRPDGQLRFEFSQGVIKSVTFMPADWQSGA